MSAAPWSKGDTVRRPTRDCPPHVLELVDWKQGGRFCVECVTHGAGPLRATAPPLQLDHLRPLSMGGDNHWSNLRWLCERHNKAKGNRPRKAGSHGR